jgi:hypothetical protein
MRLRRSPYTIDAERYGTIATSAPRLIVNSVFQIESIAAAMPLAFAVILFIILVISFRSRAVVFCQYLQTMTGIKLRPTDVRRVYKRGGANAVREYFLDLIIREDLKQGPISIPTTEEANAEATSLPN